MFPQKEKMSNFTIATVQNGACQQEECWKLRKMQHFLHLSREIKHSNLQNSVCTCVVLFSFYFSSTVAQSLFDFNKHAVAHFACFLAPFLLALPILCFQDGKVLLIWGNMLFSKIQASYLIITKHCMYAFLCFP